MIFRLYIKPKSVYLGNDFLVKRLIAHTLASELPSQPKSLLQGHKNPVFRWIVSE